METSPLICSANQWTGFCMIGTAVMKELTLSGETVLHVAPHSKPLDVFQDIQELQSFLQKYLLASKSIISTSALPLDKANMTVNNKGFIYLLTRSNLDHILRENI